MRTETHPEGTSLQGWRLLDQRLLEIPRGYWKITEDYWLSETFLQGKRLFKDDSNYLHHFSSPRSALEQSVTGAHIRICTLIKFNPFRSGLFVSVSVINFWAVIANEVALGVIFPLKQMKI